MLNKKKIIIFLAVLYTLNLAAHFMPFERGSLAPDDYVLYRWTRNADFQNPLEIFTRFPDRPLDYLILDMQSRIVGDISFYGLLFVLVISLLEVTAVFILFYILFECLDLAFMGTFIYSLIPNKLEMFHAPVYAQNSIFLTLYILSFAFFIFFVRKERLKFLIISLLCYLFAIFSYEAGYLLPVILGVYLLAVGQKKKLRYLSFFVLPAIFYAVYRTTNVFGIVSHESMNREISFASIPFKLTELFHHYFGRYMIRSILYGLYSFFTIERVWLVFIFIVDILIIVYLWIFLRKRTLFKIPRQLLLVSVFIILVFLLPIMLNSTPGIGGRHLVLPAVGVVIFLLFLVSKITRHWKKVFILISFFLVIISQGNSWNQVVACRINGAIYDTLKENMDELITADYVVIDSWSFANQIPFTWIERDFNLLNTYYGAQAFEDRGLISMVKMVADDENKQVYVSKSPLEFESLGSKVSFESTHVKGYRQVTKQNISLPTDNLVIIDYKTVYGDSFNHGKRKSVKQ